MSRYQTDKDGFVSVEEAPIEVYGVYKENGIYVRMPSEAAGKVSVRVSELNGYSAGGMIRFRTNAKCVTLRAAQPVFEPLGMGAAGYALFGFDWYEGTTFHSVLRPHYPVEDFEMQLKPWRKPTEDGFRDYTVYMPLHGAYQDISIRLEDGAELLPCTPFRNEKPVVFYGSSITQGYCASRPGMIYSNILSRKLNMKIRNLGFADSAKGEPAMADYIASCDMAAFVMDYEYNSYPDEELAERHEPFFKKVRAAHPDLPIVIVSSLPRLDAWEDKAARNAIVRKTYENAVAAGDKNVYYLRGTDFFTDAPADECLADGIHPNDMGMYYMYKGMRDTLDRIVK